MDLILTPWNAFVDLIEWGLRELALFTGSGGLAIILFTIIAKTILLPLTVKSVRSMMAMQELQPKIKDLQKKYGKDRQKLSQETLKLYSEHGVNPASGCLPMLAQMPIFFALFFSIRELSGGSDSYFNEGFLWIQDLSSPDQWELLFIPMVPIAFLAGFFQFVQMRMSRPAGQGKVRDPQQAMMQGMMNFMPLMVIIFGWNFAAGVVLYWATQSLYSVIQQWFITGWGSLKDWAPWLPELPEERRLGHRKPEDRPKPAAAATDENGEPQMSGLFGWMQRKTQEVQQRQEERARQMASQQTEQAEQQADVTAEVEEEEDEIPEGVVTISARGGQAKRRGKRRRTARGAE